LRRALFALVLTGCGGFLPFFGDDDEDPAPPPIIVVADGASDATSAEGSTTESDATREADALHLVWSCTTQAPSAPAATEEQCNGARLRESCDPASEPPIDLPCDRVGTEQLYCAQTCQRSAPGASTYSFTLTKCTCAAQP
jgi:hypothetical protein